MYVRATTVAGWLWIMNAGLDAGARPGLVAQPMQNPNYAWCAHARARMHAPARMNGTTTRTLARTRNSAHL